MKEEMSYELQPHKPTISSKDQPVLDSSRDIANPDTTLMLVTKSTF